MKEQYDEPKTEVIYLEEEDIILTSGGANRNMVPVNSIDEEPEGSAMAF